MQKLTFRHALMLCLLLSLVKMAESQANAAFSFTLGSSANTSAGVFTQGGVLVKTLWSGVQYAAGTYNQKWDGTDDNGNLAAAGSYNVRVLSNNVNYTWEGVIGNSSTAQTGGTVHHNFQGMYGMVFAGSNGYYTANYNEQLPPIMTFNTSAPQSKSFILTKGGATAYVATDGNYVYWDCMDPNNLPETFVYATKVSDNSEVTNFAYGSSVPVLYSRTYASAIDVAYDSYSKISGIGVQKRGNFLFVAHGAKNQIHVINKTTGALVNILYIKSPTGIAIDGYDALWVISGTSVLKYNVNTDASISLQNTLPNLVAPLAIAVSPDGNTIAVADGGSSQQVKAYNNYSGTPVWTLGVQGGYAADPTVADNKFYFADQDCIRSFVAFAPDGSFWVGDPGDCRAQHFSATQTFIERIMYLPHSYSSVVDPNNPTRAFADYLEFKIDYSKSLSPTNGSWALVKNWAYNITSDYDNQFYRFRYLTTLSNGHTYALLRNNYKLAVVELPATGGVRYTGIQLPTLDYQIWADGSLRTQTQVVLGKPTVWTTQPLTGFTASNNPIWGASTVLASSPPATSKDPLYYGSGNTVFTSSGMLVSFDAGLPPWGSSGYHLGGIKVGSNTWSWRTANSTFRQYTGPYPTDGSYDIGNSVQYAGNYVKALDRTVLWGYHGEFWKNGEVNKWTQVYDDGLMVGQFGVAGPAATYAEAAPMFSGNVNAASVVKDSLGNAYLYLSDEASHGGLHRWKITGLGTITEQTVPITVTYPGQGLLGQYFSGANLNTASITTTRVDPVVNLTSVTTNLLRVGSTTNAVNLSNNSTRWEGYVKPNFSDNYTFYVNSNYGVRLWVNGTLIIDQWNNTYTTQFRGTINLTAGLQYTVRMEYYNMGTASVSLWWASWNQPLQIVPSSNLYPATAADTTGGLDLMKGLSPMTTLVDNMYGWNRSPTYEDATDYYSKWWTVTTGYNTDNTTLSPDVYMRYEQYYGIYTVTRDLGANSGVTSWQLKGLADYTNNTENDVLGNGGMYLDVLDDQGKVISRFYPQAVYSLVNPQIAIHANNKILAQDSTAKMQNIMYLAQPISISAANGVVTFNYAGYPAVSTTVFDPQSNWKNPKTMRFYFWGNGNDYNRIIDVKNMRFLKTGGTATTTSSSNTSILTILGATASGAEISGPAVKSAEDSLKAQVFTIYPNPVQNVLQVQYPAVSGKGMLELFSIDGKMVQNYQLADQSTYSSLDVHALVPGAYLIRFINNNVMLSKRFLK